MPNGKTSLDGALSVLSSTNVFLGFKWRDLAVSVVIALFVCVVTTSLWYSAGLPGAMVGTLFVVLVSVTVGSLLMYRRFLAALDQRNLTGNAIVTRVDNCYRQFEALQNVRSELDITVALPPMRGWAISPDFAELLLTQLKMRNPVNVLEFGSGVSTIVIAKFLQKRGAGTVISLEHDAMYAKESSRLITEHGLQHYAKIIHAPLVSYEYDGTNWKWYDIKDLEGMERFDFLVVDGPPGCGGEMARYPLLCVMAGRLMESTVILLDDANRSDEKRIIDRWIKENPRADLTTVETEKGAAIIRL